MLNLFYITNNPKIAVIAQNSGVDRIFVDMEYIGKEIRQPNMNTVKNHHTAKDAAMIKRVLTTADLLVRVNPINKNSAGEIDSVIRAGADYIMLPMWKSVKEVEKFITIVDKRAKVMLLLETQEAADALEDVLKLDGIDEIHIGLNDLSISQKKSFLFEPLVDGTVEEITNKIKQRNIPFGIGGVGRVYGNNLFPAENIICEHYRLGSQMAILSRAFCNTESTDNLNDVRNCFEQGIKDNKNFEKHISEKSSDYLGKIHNDNIKIISDIVNGKR